MTGGAVGGAGDVGGAAKGAGDAGGAVNARWEVQEVQ